MHVLVTKRTAKLKVIGGLYLKASTRSTAVRMAATRYKTRKTRISNTKFLLTRSRYRCKEKPHHKKSSVL